MLSMQIGPVGCTLELSPKIIRVLLHQLAKVSSDVTLTHSRFLEDHQWPLWRPSINQHVWRHASRRIWHLTHGERNDAMPLSTMLLYDMVQLMSSAYSYLVYIGDERVQHVIAHNSKLNVYVQGCNVISDVYVDFGRALVVDLTSNYDTCLVETFHQDGRLWMTGRCKH